MFVCSGMLDEMCQRCDAVSGVINLPYPFVLVYVSNARPRFSVVFCSRTHVIGVLSLPYMRYTALCVVKARDSNSHIFIHYYVSIDFVFFVHVNKFWGAQIFYISIRFLQEN